MINNTLMTESYYNSAWSKRQLIQNVNGEIKIPAGFHYGLYDNETKNYYDACLRMKNYIGNLLELDKETDISVLDAGCGMGSVSLHLSNLFRNATFEGITLADSEVKLANNLKNKLQLRNVHFKKGNYLETNYPDEYFDKIFALESVCYSNDIRKFIREMKRILKPNGKLIIIDGFRKNIKKNSILHKIYQYHFKKNRAGADIIAKEQFLKESEKEGFSVTYNENLSRKVSKNYFCFFFNNGYTIVSQFVNQIVKRNIRKNKTGKHEPNNHSLTFFDGFFGLFKICSYEVMVLEK